MHLHLRLDMSTRKNPKLNRHLIDTEIDARKIDYQIRPRALHRQRTL